MLDQKERSIRVKTLVKRRCSDVRRMHITDGVAQSVWAFCESTSLHGLHHIVNDFRILNDAEKRNSMSKKKRLFMKVLSMFVWGGAALIGLCFAMTLIQLIWQRFQTTPTITTVETNYYPIWNVPFPAVTVCNVNKVYRPATRNITSKLLTLGLNESMIELYLRKLNHLIRPQMNWDKQVNDQLGIVQAAVEKLGYTTNKLMLELMQPCDSLLVYCFWLRTESPCSSLFKISKSSEGFCCSFNYADSIRITGHNDSVATQYVSGAGEDVALNMMIDVSRSNYMAYVRSYHGAQVLIHETTAYPETSISKAVSQPGYESVINVKVSVVHSDPGIRSLGLEQRGCLFPDERRLENNNIYSFESCMTECKVHAIIEKCNCIPFFYPQIDVKYYYTNYNQCTIMDTKCLFDYRSYVASTRPPNGASGFSDDPSEVGVNCTCYPSCYEESYDTQTFVNNRNESSGLFSPVYRRFNDDMMGLTTVAVYFKDTACIKYRRDMYMTWDGLFASFGGIFGLCLGGSVISLVEIGYFFTIRLILRVIANRDRDLNRAEPQRSVDSIISPRESNMIFAIHLPLTVNDEKKIESHAYF